MNRIEMYIEQIENAQAQCVKAIEGNHNIADPQRQLFVGAVSDMARAIIKLEKLNALDKARSTL